MRVPKKSLCTVRSTAVAVVMLIIAFILLDSYNRQILSPRSTFRPLHSRIPKPSSDWASLPKTREGNSQFEEGYGDEEASADANSETPPKTPGVPKSHPFRQGSSTSGTDEIIDGGQNISTPDLELPIKAVAPHSTESSVAPVDVEASAEAGAPPREPSRVAEGLLPSSAPPPVAAARPVVDVKKPSYEELSSLQKVELDLWQARAALRRVALAQAANSSDASGGGSEPSGDVYRNAPIFRQSYVEMERRFRIYAYREGEEPLVHTGPCKDIYAVEGRFIQELRPDGDSPFVTADPDTAHAFFLPFSVAMMVSYLYMPGSPDMNPLLTFARDYVRVVARDHPYWTRSNGADHFMLSCHDWGPHISRADHNLHSNSIRVLCNANISEGYVPAKDASLPEIHLVGGELSAELGGLPASERTLLAFFAGGDHGPVRPALFNSWEGKEGSIHVFHQVPLWGKSYHEYMKSTKYCLCPGGYEVNSPRIVEAIYNDCVPVVIADNFVLPFSDVLDWTKFSVHILEKEIPNLKIILEAIPMETYIQMQTRVQQVKHHFLINQPPQRYDAFHMILHSVWLRRLNIKVLG